MRRWAEERLEITLGIDKISLAELHQDFADWCGEEGIREPYINSRASFGRRLQQIEPNLIKYRNNGVWFRNATLLGR